MRTLTVTLGCLVALAIIPGCTSEKPSIEPYITAGKSHMDTHSYPEALAEFTKAVEVDSTSAEAYYYKGLAESRLGMDMQAMRSYNRCLELDSANARAYADRGGLRVMIQDYRGAVADLTRALELDEKGVGMNAFFNLGLSHYFNGNMQQSIDAMNGALRINPKDGDALAIRGHAKLALGDTSGGCFDIKAALRENSQLAPQLGAAPCP
jgi:tetratricopeptide (TPR) repeat protein